MKALTRAGFRKPESDANRLFIKDYSFIFCSFCLVKGLKKTKSDKASRQVLQGRPSKSSGRFFPSPRPTGQPRPTAGAVSACARQKPKMTQQHWVQSGRRGSLEIRLGCKRQIQEVLQEEDRMSKATAGRSFPRCSRGQTWHC